MIRTLKQFAATMKQRKVLADGLRAAMSERDRDDLAEAHIGHLKADIAELDRQIDDFRTSPVRQNLREARKAANKAKLGMGTEGGRFLQQAMARVAKRRRQLSVTQKPRLRERA